MAPVMTRVPAYVNWGRWVADCVRCPSAEQLNLMQPVFLCTECRTAAEIEWPSEEMAHGIQRLLLMRPNTTKQNWLPGETIIDLMRENAEHGIFSDLPDGLGLELVVDPEGIRVDTLPLNHRRELQALEG
jgi:hypothetical protein